MVSILVILVFSAFLGGCGFLCLASFTRGLSGSGLPGMDYLSSGL